MAADAWHLALGMPLRHGRGRASGAAANRLRRNQGWIDMARTLFFLKDELRRRLRAFRLDELRVAEITSVFDKNNRHIDVISFVIMLERYGVQRSEVSAFLHDIGVDESTLINVFSKADFTRLGVNNREITQVVLA